ncbi:hypothetical protein V8G54_034017 [Vigna mungo]|uniref:Uncharacterized protein n=1 Tax=Vigna mungo TaxID=3915 RepID=A0AAQ3MNY4_VIGMU
MLQGADASDEPAATVPVAPSSLLFIASPCEVRPTTGCNASQGVGCCSDLFLSASASYSFSILVPPRRRQRSLELNLGGFVNGRLNVRVLIYEWRWRSGGEWRRIGCLGCRGMMDVLVMGLPRKRKLDADDCG